jgi:branched-chain amino acid transport system permease protein
VQATDVHVPRRPWLSGVGAPLVAIVVVLYLVWMYGSDYTLTVLTTVAISAIVVIGLNFLVGYAGQVSFGHTAFYGTGAYMTAMGTTEWGLSPVVAMLCGLGASLLLALVIGLPTLRLRGHYLTMATFAVAIAFYTIVANSDLVHGFQGIGGIPPFGIGSWSAEGIVAKFIVAWAFCLVAAVLMWKLRFFRFGRALRTLRQDETAAQSMGLNTHRLKVTAFVISAGFASIAGSLFAHTLSYVSPETVSVVVAVNFFTMLFFGGLGTAWGSIAGACVFIVLEQRLSGLEQLQPAVTAGLLIVVLLIRPAGLLAPLSRVDRARLRGLIRRRLRTSEVDGG